MKSLQTAADEQRDRILGQLVIQVNVNLDVPFMPEDQEANAILWILNQVATVLPQSILEFMLDASDGLSEAELKRYEDMVVLMINSRVDVPWVPETVEEQVIRPIVKAAFDMAKMGTSLLPVG